VEQNKEKTTHANKQTGTGTRTCYEENTLQEKKQFVELKKC
jgi:hypothetical protein